MPRATEPDSIANRILLAFPPTALTRIWPALQLVHTVKGQTIDRVGDQVEYIYFVNSGLLSLVKTMEDGRTVEIGAVGIEGITDPFTLFGIESAALETIVQIPGKAFRIRRDSLLQEMTVDDAVRGIVQNYLRFVIRQIAQTAACNRLHSLEERCCRSLLIGHDSVRSDTFPLTHELLAMMLGAQRAGVSIAANHFKTAGLIKYSRGCVTVVDRRGLEAAACECYGAIQAELGALFRAPGPSDSCAHG